MYLFSVTVNRCLRLLYWMIEKGGGLQKKLRNNKRVKEEKDMEKRKTIKTKGSKSPKRVRSSMFKQRRQSEIVRLVLRIKAFLRRNKQ